MANAVETPTKIAEIKKDKPSSKVRKERAERLKTLRKWARLSRQKFAREHGLPYGSLQNWEDEKYGGLTKTGAPRVIEALKNEGIFVSLKWLLDGVGPVPYISANIVLKRMRIKQTANAEPSDVDEEAIKLEESLNLFRHHYRDVLNLVIPDNAMEPAFKQGDHVAGKKMPTDSIAKFIGEIALVTVKGSKEPMLRQIKAGSKPGYYSLVCINSEAGTQPMQDANIVSMAPVNWMRRKLV